MNPRSTVRIAGHPVHAMLVPFVIVFYAGIPVADLAYAHSFDPFWAHAALWLLGAGIVASAAAATVGLVDFIAEPKIRELRAAWWHLGGNGLMALISLLDFVLRTEVGPEAGSRGYIWLGFAVFALLLFSGWRGGEFVYRHGVGVKG
jgi:uncharacterized membrane protein